jgi:hypothetical protein
MTTNKGGTNKPSKMGRGNPSDTGRSKASIKTVQNIEELEEEFELEEKHTEGIDRPGQDARKGTNPNRNTGKPDIDKPSF